MSPVASRRRARSACAAIVLVACPVAAHGQDAPTTAGAPQSLPDMTLDPHSPMAAMPDLGVDWPDLAKPDAPLGILPPDETSPGAPTLFLPPPTQPGAGGKPAKAASSRTTETTGDGRYALAIEGLGDVAADGLVERFDALSSLHQGEGALANVAQIDRRAREDADLLRELLRAYGYYDAEVDARVGGAAGPTLSGQPRLAVTLSVTAGPAYAFRSVALPGLAAAGRDEQALAHAFGVKAGDPVNADRVTEGLAALKLALGQRGYAFATVAEPDITVDHDTHEATLSLAVEPGRVMHFGAYRFAGKRVFGMHHLLRISRMKPGDRYDATRLDDLRRALIQTGLVSVVQLTPIRTADP
jgi:translocation and assembly module TamA